MPPIPPRRVLVWRTILRTPPSPNIGSAPAFFLQTPLRLNFDSQAAQEIEWRKLFAIISQCLVNINVTIIDIPYLILFWNPTFPQPSSSPHAPCCPTANKSNGASLGFPFDGHLKVILGTVYSKN